MQTSYSQDPVLGQAGQVADDFLSDVETRVAGGAITAGLFVIASAAGKCTVPAAAFNIEKALGIARLDPNRTSAAYAANDSLAVIRKGRVWVEVEADSAAVADTPAYVRVTANGAGKLTLGAFRSDSDTTGDPATAHAVVVPNAYFRTSCAGGGLALLELG